jgi:enolase
VEVITGEGFPAIKVKAVVRYLNQKLNVTLSQPLSILSDENMLYDEDRLGGKGLNKTINFLKEKLAPKVKGLRCEEQENIDK